MRAYLLPPLILPCANPPAVTVLAAGSTANDNAQYRETK
jgi:hypothetical protein